MTFQVYYSLVCNGTDCTKAFPHSFQASTPVEIRAEAAAEGWVTRPPNLDYCGDCKADLPPRYALPRGVCSVCDKEMALISAGVIRSHDAPKSRHGRWQGRCDGSHRPPKAVAP